MRRHECVMGLLYGLMNGWRDEYIGFEREVSIDREWNEWIANPHGSNNDWRARENTRTYFIVRYQSSKVRS